MQKAPRGARQLTLTVLVRFHLLRNFSPDVAVLHILLFCSVLSVRRSRTVPIPPRQIHTRITAWALRTEGVKFHSSAPADRYCGIVLDNTLARTFMADGASVDLSAMEGGVPGSPTRSENVSRTTAATRRRGVGSAREALTALNALNALLRCHWRRVVALLICVLSMSCLFSVVSNNLVQ